MIGCAIFLSEVAKMADIGLNMFFSHIFDGLKMFFPLYLMVYFLRSPLGPMKKAHSQ